MECQNDVKGKTQARSSLAKTTVKNFCEGSTIHGISPMYNAKNIFMRLFWIAMFVAMWSLLVWQINKLLNKVYGTDIVISTKKTTRNDMDFPTVLVFNADPYSRERLTKYPEVFSGPNRVDRLKEVLSNISYKQLGELANDIRYSCTFDDVSCKSQTLSFPLLGSYLQFNGGRRSTQKKPGPAHGLSMILNINESDYSNLFRSGYGVLVYISKSYFITYPLLQNKGIAAAPGTLTRIKMKKKETLRLKDPYPDRCTNKTFVQSLKGFHFKFGLRYSLDFCKFNALLRSQMASCGVIDAQFNSLVDRYMIKEKSNVSLFSISNNKSETEENWRCLKMITLENIENDCSLLCNDEEYEYSVSSLRWPNSEEAIELLTEMRRRYSASSDVQNWTVDDIYKNLVKIEVFFSDFEVEVVEHVPAYGWDEFVSDLGGQVGLWIGASVYSAVEIVSFLLSLLYCLMERFCNVKLHSTKADG